MLRITIDQATSPSWVEIDAVELVGMGDASLVSTTSSLEEALAEEATPAAAAFDTPEGFLWRIGGEKAFDTLGQFPGLWGMDVDPNNGMIFITDAVYNIQMEDALSGEPLGQFKHADMRASGCKSGRPR